MTAKEKGMEIYYNNVNSGYLKFPISLAQPSRFEIVVKKAIDIALEEQAKEFQSKIRLFKSFMESGYIDSPHHINWIKDKLDEALSHKCTNTNGGKE